MSQEFKFDFANLTKSPWVTELNRHLVEYEKKAKQLARELDLRSRGAREKSLKGLEQLTGQLNKTRQDLEKRATALLQKESKRLNLKLNEFLEYVQSIAKAEKPARKAKGKQKAKSSAKRARKASAPRRDQAPVQAELNTQPTA
ncbi:MAG: hypothetical protein HYR96_08095 [Deltaproteobacteria bacterium]|nr:hypothetical protein [Deltaproteobacteria bacterium]MBI3293469.1 hypothetical protein [Deltaproteobacteria bacterium]